MGLILNMQFGLQLGSLQLDLKKKRIRIMIKWAYVIKQFPIIFQIKQLNLSCETNH